MYLCSPWASNHCSSIIFVTHHHITRSSHTALSPPFYDHWVAGTLLHSSNTLVQAESHPTFSPQSFIIDIFNTSSLLWTMCGPPGGLIFVCGGTLLSFSGSDPRVHHFDHSLVLILNTQPRSILMSLFQVSMNLDPSRVMGNINAPWEPYAFPRQQFLVV